MSLRRYAQMKPSRGTVIPAALRQAVFERDRGCVGFDLNFPVAHIPFQLEIDHVRSSGALGKKSATDLSNLVALCPACHRYKTEHGREVRPLLLAYLERKETL